MKKRKELDALLGNRGKGAYEQMHASSFRPEPASSSSRDGEAFFTPAPTFTSSPYSKRVGRNIPQTKRSPSCSSKRFFYLCLPICIFALVAACVSSSVGIVWMQMQLKSDIEEMKERLSKLERLREDEPASLMDLQNSVKFLEDEMKKEKDGMRVMSVKMGLLVEQSETNSRAQPSATGLSVSFEQLKEELAKTRSDVSDIHEVLDKIRLSQTVLRKEVSDQENKLKHDYDVTNELGQFVSSLKGLEERTDKLENSTSLLLVKEEQSYSKEEITLLIQDMTFMNSSILALHDKDVILTNHINRLDQNMLQVMNNTVGSDPSRVVKKKLSSFHEVPKMKVSNKHISDEDNSDSTSDGGTSRTSSREPKKHKNTPVNKSGDIHPSRDASVGGKAVADVTSDEVLPSDDTSVRVGDTTTSFTELPRDKHS